MGSTFSGSDPSLGFSQSPEAQQLWQMFSPVLQRAAGAAGQPNSWNSLNAPMPTQSWFENLSPDVKQGVWAPYEEAGQNMLSGLIGGGMAGSARGGMSRNATNLLGDYYAKAGTNYGQQLWNMSYPGMQQAWNTPYNLMGALTGSAMPNTVVYPGQTGIGEAALYGGAANMTNYLTNPSNWGSMWDTGKSIWNTISNWF